MLIFWGGKYVSSLFGRVRAAVAVSALSLSLPLSALATSIPTLPSGESNFAMAETAISRSPVVKSRFAAAVNQLLVSDSDFDRYIDSNIVGRDRLLARRLMRLMPPGQRGDFVYYDGNHVVSNNTALLATALISSAPFRRQSPQRRRAAGIGLSMLARPMSAGGCSPPDPYGGTGPYARMVSNCGFSGGWSIVNLPCGETNLTQASDYGYMYLELRDQAAALYEAGLFVPSYLGGEDQINPYLSATLGLSLNNNSARYTCGSDLAILSGLIPVPNQEPMFMAEMGNVPGWNAL